MPKKQWEVYAPDQWSYYGAVGEETYCIVFNDADKYLILLWESELTFEMPLLIIPYAEKPTVQQAISVIAKAMAKRIRSL